ncbi:hypothetical protein ACO0QE_000595 [Hanseniaspora vineae]
MSNEDPFYDVLNDVKNQLKDLNTEKNYSNGLSSASPEVREVYETVQDLKTSFQMSKPYLQPTELQKRESEISRLENQYYVLLHNLNNVSSTNNISDSIELQDQDTAFSTEHFNMPENDDMDTQDKFTHLESQMLHEQDDQLDQITKTMQNLRTQANLMGSELQDHTELLDSIDSNMNTLQGKLKKSSQKLQWIYEKNKERYNTICIMLLIVVLIILLFLTIIA